MGCTSSHDNPNDVVVGKSANNHKDRYVVVFDDNDDKDRIDAVKKFLSSRCNIIPVDMVGNQPCLYFVNIVSDKMDGMIDSSKMDVCAKNHRDKLIIIGIKLTSDPDRGNEVINVWKHPLVMLYHSISDGFDIRANNDFSSMLNKKLSEF